VCERGCLVCLSWRVCLSFWVDGWRSLVRGCVCTPSVCLSYPQRSSHRLCWIAAKYLSALRSCSMCEHEPGAQVGGHRLRRHTCHSTPLQQRLVRLTYPQFFLMRGPAAGRWPCLGSLCCCSGCRVCWEPTEGARNSPTGASLIGVMCCIHFCLDCTTRLPLSERDLRGFGSGWLLKVCAHMLTRGG